MARIICIGVVNALDIGGLLGSWGARGRNGSRFGGARVVPRALLMAMAEEDEPEGQEEGDHDEGPVDPSKRHHGVDKVDDEAGASTTAAVKATSSNHRRKEGRADEPEDHGYKHHRHLDGESSGDIIHSQEHCKKDSRKDSPGRAEDEVAGPGSDGRREAEKTSTELPCQISRETKLNNCEDDGEDQNDDVG